MVERSASGGRTAYALELQSRTKRPREHGETLPRPQTSEQIPDQI